MKHLLILIASVLLFSCKKTEPLQITETKDYYYKIVEFDLNGKPSESPVKHLSYTNSAVSDEGEEDDDDDHHTCLIKLETISVTQSGNIVTIYWEAENEINVHHYEVQKSTDAINYESLCTKQVSPDGKYKVVDIIK